MDYDMAIHHNADAQAWAKLFIETTKDMDRDVFRDEGYMIAWFANAMMAMHDYLHKTEIERLREALLDAVGFVSRADSLFLRKSTTDTLKGIPDGYR